MMGNGEGARKMRERGELTENTNANINMFETYWRLLTTSTKAGKLTVLNLEFCFPCESNEGLNG